MLYSVLAAAVVALHLAYILFVVSGGLLVLRRRSWAWLHVPAVLWGALVEFTGWLCPLTPIENELRRLAGERGYESSFVEHYLIPLAYPSGLTRTVQIALGSFVVVVNVAIYALFIRRARRRRRGH